MHSILLAQTAMASVAWTPATGGVMIISNVLAIAIGKATMKDPGTGPALPMPAMFGGMGWPALLATTSLGHVMGFAFIFLLRSYGLV